MIPRWLHFPADSRNATASTLQNKRANQGLEGNRSLYTLHNCFFKCHPINPIHMIAMIHFSRVNFEFHVKSSKPHMCHGQSVASLVWLPRCCWDCFFNAYMNPKLNGLITMPEKNIYIYEYVYIYMYKYVGYRYIISPWHTPMTILGFHRFNGSNPNICLIIK